LRESAIDGNLGAFGCEQLRARATDAATGAVTMAILPVSLPMYISFEDAEDLVQVENIAQY